MKSIGKVLALCLCFGLVITMCACKGGGGGSSSSSSSSTSSWTTGSCVATYKFDADHWFAFMSDGKVGLYDLVKDRNSGNPRKVESWTKSTDNDPANGKVKMTFDGKSIDNTGTGTGTVNVFKYTCECGEKTYTKQ